MAEMQTIEIADREYAPAGRRVTELGATAYYPHWDRLRPVGLLARHFTSRFSTAFVACSLILIAALFLVGMLADLDALVRSPADFVVELRLLALRIPADYLPILIPIAALAAGLLCFGTAARHREIAAAKCGGISPLRLTLPALGISLVLAGAAFAVNETLGLRAQRTLLRLESGEVGELSYQEDYFWYRRGHFIYRIRSAEAAEKVLRGVEIYELNPQGRLVRRMEAVQAHWEQSDLWLLEDVLEQRFNPDQPAAPPRDRHNRALELSLPRDTPLLGAGSTLLSTRDLLTYWRQRGAEDAEGRRGLALIHQRIANALSTALFAALGIALGMRVEHSRSLARSGLWAIIALFGFAMARRYGETLATMGLLTPVAALWLPLSLFALATAVQWRRVVS